MGNKALLIKYEISVMDLELLEVISKYKAVPLEDLARFYTATSSRSIEMVKCAIDWAYANNMDIMDYLN